MAFRKFAKASILGVDTNRGMSKSAHRAHFEYEPRPGYIYVRCRAISSRTNDNFDNFPAEEIKLGYKSFEGKPVFINHQNTNHRRARGVILQAALHEDVLEDGTEDTWVELLQEIDATNFPLLAQAILDGEVDRTSMGCDITHSKCSACGNIAQTPAEYCSHIPNKKGQKIRRTASDGSVEDVLIYEVCSGLSFFENSILVEEPADPTALFLGVDDRGIGGGYRGEVPVMASKSQKRRKQARRKKAAAMARTASKTAIGETKAPPRVDTLRDEKCPICAESDSFDGVECRVCGYTKPPDEFMDPNLDLAGEVDFRQEQSGDPGADVVVDEGGAEVEEDDASALIDGDVEGEDEDDLGEDDEDDEGQFSLQDAEEDSEDEEEVGPTLKGEQFTLTQSPDEDEEFEVDDDEPDMSEEDESDDDSEDDEEEDPESDDEDDPKDKKKSSSRLAGQTLSGEGTHTMNALEALALQRNNKKLAARNAHLVRQARNQSLVIATQSEKLAAQGAAISRIAKKAGVDLSDIQRVERRKLASLRKRADADNPAQPIPDGPTQAPSQTTEEARNPGGNSTGLSDSHGDGTMADVTQIGGDIDSSDPDVNTDLMEIGGIVGDELDLDEVDVTSPVEGTTDGAGQTETDGDVTAIDEVRPETAFPIESARKRTFSALKLARLRIEAGIAEGDDLVVGEKIASSKMTDREIAHEIGTIASVMNKGASREASRNLVPRSASRSVPSMGITANASAPAAIIAGSSRPVADSFLFD